MCVELVGQVVEIPSDKEGVAVVSVDGRLRRVSTALLLVEGVDVSVGQWLQTHTGLAVRVLPESEARQLVKAYEEMRSAPEGG